MNDFTVAVTVTQILRTLGRANDTVYHANPMEMKALTLGVSQMYDSGCQFTDNEIDLLVDGEGSECAEYFFNNRYAGWGLVNTVLDFIFDQEDDEGAGDEDGLCRAQII